MGSTFFGLMFMDDVIDDVRNLLRSWGWTEDRIGADLPRIIQVFVEVGTLAPVQADGFEVTELVSSDEAWKRFRDLARERGIGGGLPAG